MRIILWLRLNAQCPAVCNREKVNWILDRVTLAVSGLLNQMCSYFLHTGSRLGTEYDQFPFRKFQSDFWERVTEFHNHTLPYHQLTTIIPRSTQPSLSEICSEFEDWNQGELIGINWRRSGDCSFWRPTDWIGVYQTGLSIIGIYGFAGSIASSKYCFCDSS